MREQVLTAGRERRPLRIRGHGTKDFLGGELTGSVLDTGALSGVIDYDPAELVMTARSGTPLSAVETLLGRRGQFLAFEPPAFNGDPTLGGIIATGLAGPRRASAGAVRDFVLGVKLLTAGGELLSFGGRVMKNVAGFDVARLVCGSFGILGVIVEASVKVLPLPAAELTLAFELDAGAAIAAFNRWSRRPWPVSASCWHDGVARLRLSGAGPAIAAACRELGGEPQDALAAQRWWRGVRDHGHPFLAAAGPLWRLSLPPTSTAALPAGAQLIEWAGALRWLRCEAPAAEVREAACRAGGSAALWHAASREPLHGTLPPPLLAIHRRLKDSFDPQRIFNPGRLLAEL